MGTGTVHEATVAELITDDNAIAQVSLLPTGDGFLIRAWPPNGTAEHGGTNIEVLSVVLRIEDGKLNIESLRAER